MKRLVYHDWKMIQDNMMGYFLFLVVVSFFVKGSHYFSSYMFTMIMIRTLHSNLDKNKSKNILVSFPVTRKQIVLARYVSTLIITAINTLIPPCVLTIQYLWDQSRPFPDWDFAIFMFVITLLHLFLYLPFYFRFGNNNISKIAFYIIPFFTLFLAISLGFMFDINITPKEFVAQNLLWFILGSLLFLTIAGLFSLFCSIHLYKKRES